MQVDSVGAGMPNQFQGGQQIRPGGPLLPPSSGGMPGGPSPSPNSMIQGLVNLILVLGINLFIILRILFKLAFLVYRQNQPGFANSPQPPHPQGSPAPPQNVGIRPLGSKIQLPINTIGNSTIKTISNNCVFLLDRSNDSISHNERQHSNANGSNAKSKKRRRIGMYEEN